MSVELKPLGNSCNLACTYCYQEPMRAAGNARGYSKYDIDLMIEKADEAIKSGKATKKDGYTIFGGEALLTPKKDLERLLKHSYEQYGKSTIQTNGSLIDDDHIELFKKYNVNIGFSIDGPGELNSLRVPASERQSTEELTKQSINNLIKITKNKINAGIIITVHKKNGTGENLDTLLSFIRLLGNHGCTSGNIHMLEIDSIEAEKYALSSEENTAAFIKIAEFLDEPSNKDLYYNPFKEMEDLMSGNTESANCVFSSCDALDTTAVYGVEGNGQITNCGMVNKEGIEWTKSDNSNILSRDIILYHTPPEFGGCGGCPYFILCNGYCTGSAYNGDWRNKTIYCQSLKKIFSYYEDKLIKRGEKPWSTRPEREVLEELYIHRAQNGSKRTSIKDLYRIASSIKKGLNKDASKG